MYYIVNERICQTFIGDFYNIFIIRKEKKSDAVGRPIFNGFITTKKGVYQAADPHIIICEYYKTGFSLTQQVSLQALPFCCLRYSYEEHPS